MPVAIESNIATAASFVSPRFWLNLDRAIRNKDKRLGEADSHNPNKLSRQVNVQVEQTTMCVGLEFEVHPDCRINIEFPPKDFGDVTTAEILESMGIHGSGNMVMPTVFYADTSVDGMPESPLVSTDYAPLALYGRMRWNTAIARLGRNGNITEITTAGDEIVDKELRPVFEAHREAVVQALKIVVADQS